MEIEINKRLRNHEGLCKSNDDIKQEIAKFLKELSIREKRFIPKQVFLDAFWMYKTNNQS